MWGIASFLLPPGGNVLSEPFESKNKTFQVMKKKRIVAFLKTTMRITILQILLAISFTWASFASSVEAQALDKEVSIVLNDADIGFALRQLQRKAHVKFVYSPTAIRVKHNITLDVKNQTLGAILDQIFIPEGIRYRVVKDRIVLFKDKDAPAETPPPARADAPPTGAIAVLTIGGKVVDDRGEAMPGVSVVVKGTNIGAYTDVNGNFTLTVPAEHAQGILIFSFVGFITAEVRIDNQTLINVQLQQDVTSLGEVVVVGYGEQRKKNIVGANASVNVSELKQPVANIGTMLAGRIAGVVQVQRNGEPGRDAANIWIRGLSSWPAYGGTSPLVLVDGVERSINNIDPQDVESFNVLKDASATAVYGMRGANGVILITTKKGVNSKTVIDFNYAQGVTSFTKVPELADGPTFMRLTNEALTTRGDAPKFTQEQIDRTESGADPYVYPNVDWYDAVFNKNAANRRVNLNARGGSDKARYYVSAAYYDEEGFFKTDGLEQYNSTTKFTRYNFTSNINMDLTKTTVLDLGIQGYVSNANYPGEASENVFGQIMLTSPVAYPVMYPGGLVPGQEVNGDFRNPYADITQRGYRNQFRNQLYSNIRATQDLAFVAPGLSFTTLFSFDAWNAHDINRQKRKDTYFVDANSPRNPDGTLNLNLTYSSGSPTLGYSRGTNSNRRFYSESALNYNRNFGDHYVTGMLLYNQTDYTDAGADDFTGSIPYRNRGLAGRFTYAFKDRYFLEANFGYNGSENFAPDRRYGFFPSYGVGWVVSEEPFYTPVKRYLQLLKLRFSDGLVGIAGGGRRFGYITIVSNVDRPGYSFGLPGSTNYSGGIEVTDYAVDVGWATSHKSNLGIDTKFFNEHVSLTVDLWKERRTDVFLPRGAVPSYVGLYNQPWGNLGQIDNKGIDIALEASNIKVGELLIMTRANFNYNRDKVIENDQPNPQYPWLEQRGSNVLAYWGYQAEGLFTSQEDIDNHATQNWGQVLPGDIKYKDMNNDGLIDNLDRVKIGRGDVPRITYGVGFNLMWKNFDVGAFFQGTAQADRAVSGFGVMPFSGGSGAGNVYAVATDRWTVENPNPNATYPRLSYGTEYANNTQTSSWWVRDVSFLRLKTAEIGYTLSGDKLHNLGVINARLYFTGVNLLTFSKFDLWDPELNTSNGTVYPNVRTMSLGVNISF